MDMNARCRPKIELGVEADFNGFGCGQEYFLACFVDLLRAVLLIPLGDYVQGLA